MSAELIVPALVALAPVLAFLAALLYLDSYKLVKLRMVVALVVCGAAAAGIGYLLNGKLFAMLAIDRETFARYV